MSSDDDFGDDDFDDGESREPLPAAIPVFPLSGALLLPRGLLPLNIFEPRYLAMVRDAMAAQGSAERVIGMIQPKDDGDQPALYGVGCLGRISDCRKTGDGRLLITLAGVTRFRVQAELDRDTPYRQVLADYDGFGEDRADADPLPAAARANLEEVLQSFLDAKGLAADWDAVRSADDEALVTTLAAVCPFEAVERQALLEAPTLADRASTLTTLMTFAQGPYAGDADLGPTLQ